MELKTATRKKVKLKLGLSSPTGFGKTYSALLLAHGMVKDWTKIAVIDSENESAELYCHLGNYQTISMKPPYTVDRFCEAVKMCVDKGIELIIVDSTYHYWHGKGGLLEYNNSLGGRYQDWAKTNPLYAKWLDTILQTPVHFICTSRKKQAYEMVKVDGKITVEKKGMEDQVRDGFDYEMTIAFSIINNKHLTEASKDRTQLFTGLPEFVITEETGRKILEWCESGVEVIQGPTPKDSAIQRLKDSKDIKELAAQYNTLSNELKKDLDIMKLKEERKAELTQPSLQIINGMIDEKHEQIKELLNK